MKNDKGKSTENIKKCRKNQKLLQLSFRRIYFFQNDFCNIFKFQLYTEMNHCLSEKQHGSLKIKIIANLNKEVK